MLFSRVPATDNLVQALQPLKLSSALDDETLEQMRQMRMSSGASFISFQVLAVARYAGAPHRSSAPCARPTHAPLPAEPKSRLGSLVVVYTHVGELTLDGEAVYFHESLAGAFSRAGFVVDSSGRRLLGVLDVIGMFNTISKAAQDALARDPAAEVPAALPTEFVARVIYTEACEDKRGRSYGVCELPDGRRANWLTQDREDGAVMRQEEAQYSLKVAGRRFAKETATSEQWPGQSVTALYNETHQLVFQTFRGVNYHCELTQESSLGSPPPVSDATSIAMVGYKEVAGVYCRHFQMTVPMSEGPAQTVHLYEDYTRRRILAVRFGNMQWLFANLTAVRSEAENPLAPQDLDIEAVLRTCNPPGVAAPARIVRGLLTPRLDMDPEWGQPVPNTTADSALQLNASLEPLTVHNGPPLSRRRSLGKAGVNVSDPDLRSCYFRRGARYFSLEIDSCDPAVWFCEISGSSWSCPIISGAFRWRLRRPPPPGAA
jgi:hypothetical protein